MRLTRSVRTSFAIMAGFAVVGIVGCGRSASTGKVGSTTSSGTSPSRQAASTMATARQAAEAFVQSIQAGNPQADQLTADYKKVIAEPGLAAERELGYSDSGAVKWLTAFSGRKFALDPKPIFDTAEAAGFRGTITGGEADRSFSLRLLKNKAGWLVDWFGPVGPAGVAVPASSSPAAGFAAAAFLDAVVARADELAIGMLTPEAKAKHGPPFASDQARGYNQGILRRQLDELRAGATNYNLTKITDTTIVAQLGEQPITLTLKQGQQAGVWFVDEWTAK